MFEDMGLSKDTEVLLGTLIKRKHKYDRYKQLNRIGAVMNLFIVLLVILVLYRLHAFSFTDPFDLLHYLLSGPSIMLILLGAFCVVYSNWVNAKYQKAKKKYETLRSETVAKLNADWELNQRSYKRDEVSELLDRHYGINIRYIS